MMMELCVRHHVVMGMWLLSWQAGPLEVRPGPVEPRVQQAPQPLRLHALLLRRQGETPLMITTSRILPMISRFIALALVAVGRDGVSVWSGAGLPGPPAVDHGAANLHRQGK